MKNRQALLFYILAVISMSLIPLVWWRSKDVVAHDNSYVDLYFKYLIVTTILSALTGLVYSLMQKMGRPISSLTGNIHFTLIFIGLIFSRNIYLFVMGFFIFGFLPDTASFASDISSIISLLLGPTLLLIGLIVFVYGLTRAIRRKTNVY